VLKKGKLSIGFGCGLGKEKTTQPIENLCTFSAIGLRNARGAMFLRGWGYIIFTETRK